MSDQDVNPYTPPNSLEAYKTPHASGKRTRPGLRIGAALWWGYFLICCWILAVDLPRLATVVRLYSFSALISPIGFATLTNALGLVGVLCYIRKVPLFHSFFWGLAFLAQLGHTVYLIVITVNGIAKLETINWSWRAALFVSLPLILLPQSYALWRYSSTSSPIWKAPHIQWKKLALQLWDAIIRMRRA